MGIRYSKGLSPGLIKRIENGELLVMNSESGEMENIKIDKDSYKYKLNLNKGYMKLWQLPTIKKDILERVGNYTKYLYILPDFIDYDNVINFRKFNKLYKLSNSDIKRFRDPLIKAGLVRKYEGEWYLSPLVGVKKDTIPQELLIIFEDTFEKYGVDLTLN